MTTSSPQYLKHLNSMMTKLRNSNDIEIGFELIELPRQDMPTALTDFPDLLGLYQELDTFELSWHLKQQENPDYSGTAKIISSRYFDDGQTPFQLSSQNFWVVNDHRRTLDGKFFPIDIIEDNASVGVFATKDIAKSEVFYYDYGINFYSLKVDWWGYWKLLEKSLAVRYWQVAILDWEYGHSSTEVDVFEEILNMVSQDFTFNDFRNYYEQQKEDAFE